MGQVVADEAEFATLKNDVKHIEQKVTSIEADVSGINKSYSSVSESLAVLTTILKHGQEADEKRNIRLDKQDEEISKIKVFMYKMMGAGFVVFGLASLLSPFVLTLLSSE